MHRIEETISRGMCIGCGACAAASQGQITLRLGATRLWQADISAADETAIRRGSAVCPFSDESPNETQLGAPDTDDRMLADKYLGWHSRTFAGRVSDDDYVLGSSSGGLTSWLAGKLVLDGHADAVICVGQASSDSHRLIETLIADAPEVREHRKSQYYATTMAEAFDQIASSDRRYVLIGVPCFVRAARALCLTDKELATRITFFIALVCGHYKTQAFAESLAWQLGVPPDRLSAVDFRRKRLDRRADDYDFAARDAVDGEWRTAPTRELVGGNWGHSAFQPGACDFCDDVVGETADVSFGDAWLPQFVGNPRGTNIVVTRNRLIDSIFDSGVRDGEIEVTDLSPGEVYESQAGGFRNRRGGLALRLADDLEAGLSVPAKRVAPDASQVTKRRARLLRRRRIMAASSHTAFARALEASDLDIYLKAQRREIARYRRAELPIHRRFVASARRVARRLLDTWARILHSDRSR